jgi:hypothetical protein
MSPPALGAGRPCRSLLAGLFGSLAAHAVFLLLPLACAAPTPSARLSVFLVSAPVIEELTMPLPPMSPRQPTVNATAGETASDSPIGSSPAHDPEPSRLTDEPSSTAAWVGLAATIYYPGSELTRRPQVIENIDYSSAELLRPGRSGRAVLTLYINALGTIDRVAVDESDFDAEAEVLIANEFSRLRFSPASKDARAVASKLRIETVLRN